MSTPESKPRTRREAKAALGPYGRVGKMVGELDERLGVAKGGRTLLDKIFPDHWSFMLGEIAMYSFVVLIATGIFLSLYYVPSQATVIYHAGSNGYQPLNGYHMSEAYQSTVNLSFSVRAGLLMRQMHHWAADVFVGSIVIHMARVFFTGAFRKPRELNWTIGIVMLIMAILNGFIGYSLPDDLISGTGIRIGYSIVLSIPLVGSYLATFLFGGNFPGQIIIERFYLIHILIIPVAIGGLLAAHLGLMVRQKHTQFPGKGRTEHNIIGTPMFPTFMAKTTGFLLMVSGGLALLGGLAQINPIWQFGPYEADKISYAVQPDWYMGWLDGALRIMPSWEWTGWGHTIPLEVFLPAVIFPGIIFNICFVWPALERKLTKDNEMHNLLERPRDRPKRTAAGAAMLALLFMCFAASSTDVLANFFHVSLNEVLWFFRIAVILVPIIVALVTWQICREMQGVHGIGKRKRALIVSRSATGEYLAEPSEPRPGDEEHELDPEPVPDRIDLEPESVGAGAADGASPGVRKVTR
jgi:ubiquinol-cytochrome c reductase cytochrome b subunit